MSQEVYGDSLMPDEIMGSWASIEPGPEVFGAECFINADTGERMYIGEGGGSIYFASGEDVKAIWNRHAALASAFARGNRKARITKKPDRYAPPDLDEMFNQVAACRRYFLTEPSDPSANPDNDSGEDFLRIFSDLSKKMLLAVGEGRPGELEVIAEHVRNYERLASGKEQFPINHWEDIARSIESASKLANGVPMMSSVSKSYMASKGGISQSYVYEELAKMGFGWLPKQKRE